MITYADRKPTMRGPSSTFSIGTSAGTCLNELLAAFQHVVGHPAEREYALARPSEVQKIVLDAGGACYREESL